MDITDLITALPPELAEYETDEAPEVQAIANQTSADWALQRVAECEAEEAAIEAQYQAACERLRARRDQLVARAQKGQRYFRFRLEQWAVANRKALLRGKAKSVSMLHGRIGWRAKGGGLKVADKDALAVWLEEQPEGSPLVRIKREPVMDALKKHLAETGEIPAGCEVVEESETFYATAEAPETALAKE